MTTTTTKKKLRPVVKIHGGKFYLASWITDNFPSNYAELSYLEPYLGAGSVLLNKDVACVEAVNDADVGIIQIFRALRDEPSAFIRRLKRTNYTERTFVRAKNKITSGEYKDYMDHAVNEFILRRMSRGGLKQAFAWSDRQRGGKPGDVNAWLTIVEELPLIAKRLEGIHIFNKPAVEVIKAFDDEDFLCYCDPPYLPSTRVSTSAYDIEMTTDDHVALVEALKLYRGRVIISGYPSTLYRRAFADWRYIRKNIANHASQQRVKSRKVECIWMNYDAKGKLIALKKKPRPPKPTEAK